MKTVSKRYSPVSMKTVCKRLLSSQYKDGLKRLHSQYEDGQ